MKYQADPKLSVFSTLREHCSGNKSKEKTKSTRKITEKHEKRDDPQVDT